MLKKLTILLFLLTASAVALIVVVLSALQPAPRQSPAVRAAAVFRNEAGLSALSAESEFVKNASDTYTANTFASLLNHFYAKQNLLPPFSQYALSTEVAGLMFEEGSIGTLLLDLKAEKDPLPRDARLIIKDSRAVEFQPHKQGELVLLKGSREALKLSLLSGGQSDTFSPVVFFTPPRVKLGDLNNLGILEKIGEGASDFSGSTRSRIHNIRVGAEKFNGVIIPWGEEFSFNQHLGPVTAAAGYLPELVIKPEGTVPEFGGGLCQVSSTAFRAAFFTGTKITQRKNHSYAVKYYEWINEGLPKSHGMDATIYPGAVDMKFLNDTGGAILVWTRMEGNRLYFDFYGTPDGRKVVVEELKTFDRRADGAMKASVTRRVIKDGEEYEQAFTSSYVSPDRYPRVYGYSEENINQTEESEDDAI